MTSADNAQDWAQQGIDQWAQHGVDELTEREATERAELGEPAEGSDGRVDRVPTGRRALRRGNIELPE